MNYNDQVLYKTGQFKYQQNHKSVEKQNSSINYLQQFASQTQEPFNPYHQFSRTDQNFYSGRENRRDQQNYQNQLSKYKRYEMPSNMYRYDQQSFGDNEIQHTQEQKLKNLIERELKQYLSKEIMQMQERIYYQLAEEIKTENNQTIQQEIMKQLRERENQQSLDQQMKQNIYENQQVQLTSIWQQIQIIQQQQQQSQQQIKQQIEILKQSQIFNIIQEQVQNLVKQLEQQNHDINSIQQQTNKLDQLYNQQQIKHEQIVQEYNQNQQKQEQAAVKNTELFNKIFSTLSQYNNQQSQIANIQKDLQSTQGSQLNSLAIQQLKQELYKDVSNIQEQISNIPTLENNIGSYIKELENLKFQLNVLIEQVNYIQKSIPTKKEKLEINIIEQSYDQVIEQDNALINELI